MIGRVLRDAMRDVDTPERIAWRHADNAAVEALRVDFEARLAEAATDGPPAVLKVLEWHETARAGLRDELLRKLATCEPNTP